MDRSVSLRMKSGKNFDLTILKTANFNQFFQSGQQPTSDDKIGIWPFRFEPPNLDQF